MANPNLNDGNLIQAVGSAVYQIVNGQIWGLPSWETAVSLYGPDWKSLVQIVTAEQLNSFPVGTPYSLEACLVGLSNEYGPPEQIGVFSSGNYFAIANPAAFNFYGQVWPVPQAVFNAMPQGTPIR